MPVLTNKITHAYDFTDLFAGSIIYSDQETLCVPNKMKTDCRFIASGCSCCCRTFSHPSSKHCNTSHPI